MGHIWQEQWEGHVDNAQARRDAAAHCGRTDVLDFRAPRSMDWRAHAHTCRVLLLDRRWRMLCGV